MFYAPAEDSYLLSKILKKEIKNPHIKILEIGVGSGIQLQTLKEIGINKKNIFGVDINPDAVRHCNMLGFCCIKSDLFKNIKDKFDIIIFNPPYLPEDEDEPENSKTATTGGKEGSEIINRFLCDAENYLKKEGKIYLLTSSLTQKINWGKWNKKLLDSQKLFFEELFIWKLQR